MFSTQPETVSDRILLSLSIPTYNRAPFLKLALESILPQIDESKAGRTEIWITDNASTDETSQVVNKLIQSYNHLRIEYRCNPSNIGAERNVVQAAGLGTGEYSWIFGDDDLMCPGALDVLWPHLERGEVDFFLLNKTVRNSDLSEVIYEKQNLHSGIIRFEGLLDLTMVFGYITQLGFISSAVFRREPFLMVDPEPYIALRSFYPQNGIWLEAFHHRPSTYLPQVMVCHRQYNQNQDSIQEGQNNGLIMPLIEMLLLLHRRGALSIEVMGHIVERPLLESHQSLTGFFLTVLAKYLQRGGDLSPDDWIKIVKVLDSTKSKSVTTEALRLYHQFLLNLINRGDVDGTIAHTQRLGQVVVNFFGVHEALGLALRKKGDVQGAIAALDQAVRCAPNRVVAYEHLGLALFAAGRFEQAKRVSEVGLRLDPRHDGLNQLLAEASCKLGDWNRAIQAAGAVVGRHPGDARLAVWLGLILMAGNHTEEAHRLLNRIAALDGGSVQGLEQLRGLLAWRQGELQGAIRHLERERDLFPDNRAAAAQLSEMGRIVRSAPTTPPQAEQTGSPVGRERR